MADQSMCTLLQPDYKRQLQSCVTLVPYKPLHIVSME